MTATKVRLHDIAITIPTFCEDVRVSKVLTMIGELSHGPGLETIGRIVEWLKSESIPVDLEGKDEFEDMRAAVIAAFETHYAQESSNGKLKPPNGAPALPDAANTVDLPGASDNGNGHASSNGDPNATNTAAEVMAAGTGDTNGATASAEPVVSVDGTDDDPDEAVQSQIESYKGEADSAESVRDAIVGDRQKRRESTRLVRDAQAASRQRVQTAQWGIIGALIGDVDAHMADELAAEVKGDEVDPSAALLAGYMQTAPTDSRLLRSSKTAIPEKTEKQEDTGGDSS